MSASLREQVTQALDTLSDAELQRVAEYLAFLKHRSRLAPTPMLDTAAVADLYAEFADEDRALAEEGMGDYFEQLRIEDEK